MNLKSIFPALFAGLLLPASALAEQAEVAVDLSQQTRVAVTIYNDDLALIKDQRQVTLPAGENALALQDISARIRPETALLRSVDSPGSLRLVEQNFDYDLLTPQKLLDKYVGRKIRVIRTNSATGNENIEVATVLSTQQGVVLQFDDRIETGSPGRMVFDEVPDNLRDRPTLVMKLISEIDGEQLIELSYLTGGLSWQADYVANLSADETRLALNGWVTLRNESGASYGNAVLQLVAGDVQQVRPALQRQVKGEVMMASAPMEADMVEESLFEYHLYTLERPTDIRNRQSKQVALLSAEEIPVSKQYLLDGVSQYYMSRFGGQAPRKEKIGVHMMFTNDEASRLGIPLPRGVLRVYKNDTAGRAQFVGEDRIDHTPRGEDVRVKLGNAFDVTAERVQDSFKKLQSQGQYSFTAEVGHRITLKNAKSEAVTVRVREPVPGDWKMLSESTPHQTVSSGLVEWDVTVPPESSVVHEYRVLVRF